MSEVNQVSAADTFNGDNNHLISCIKSLLSLDEKGALVPHGVGGHARTMLSSAAQRLSDFDRVTAEFAELREWSSRLDALHVDEIKSHRRTTDAAIKASRERDAALLAVDRLGGTIEKLSAEILDRNQRLTAADERADVLETALKKISARCVAYIEAEREMPEPSVEVCQMIASAALKPAEGGGDEYRKSCEVAHKALSMENQRITPVRRETDPRVIDALREAGYLRND